MTPPAYSVPAFSAATVALNEVVTTVTLISTASAAEINKPFTFGQVFKKGEIAPGDFLLGKIAGEADLPLQFNVKATHPDGSVRHAVVSGVLPALAAGASKVLSLVRANSTSVSTAATASSAFTAGGFSAWANIYFGTDLHTANPAAAMAANIDPAKAWLAGGVATEYSMLLPVVASAGGATHPHLKVQFNIRFYPGANAAKVDITFEHAGPYTALGDLAYTGALRIAGVQRDTFDIVHFPFTRWKKTLWWNNDNPLHVKHNRDYLIDSKQLPNYDRRVTVPESTLAGYVTLLADTSKFKPMGAGPFAKGMGGTGGRPDIGILHGWAAAAALSMDKRAVSLALACGDVGGSFGSHLRDTSTGPGAGMPMSVINWPYATLLGNPGDAANPTTGQNERLPRRDEPSGYTTASDMYPEESHQPNFAYLPYLLTGDYFYLEELQFWATWNITSYNPGYRLWEKGLVRPTQVRGQAWNMRTLGEAAALTPDAHPLKSHFKYWIDQNLADYNALFTDKAGANALGINDSEGAVVYTFSGIGGSGMAPWQDDHFTSAIGHVAELGYTEALRLLAWKAKFQIGRLIAPGACWIHAATYQLRVRDGSTGPLYTTLAECFAGTANGTFDGNYLTPAVHALPCNSQARLNQMNAELGGQTNPFLLSEMTGFGYNTDGFPANLQPALAMAVDTGYTDGDLAWDLFDSRTNGPNYGLSPQYAIVPRGYVAGPPPDPVPDPPTEPTIMTIADRVKDSTTTTGTGAFALAGAPPLNFRPFLTAPIVVGSLVPYAANHRTLNEWEDGFGTLTAALTLARTTVTASSNNNQPVNFSAGIKDVSCDLTAEFMARYASPESAATTVVANQATSNFVIEEGGVMKRIPVATALALAEGGAAPAGAMTVSDVAFNTAIPLSTPGHAYMPQQSVSGGLAFTVGASPVRGALVYLRLVANGVNIPTFTGFKEWGGSSGYDNRAGIANQVQFFYDGVDYWYSISQAVGAVAIDTVAPTITSAAVANGTPSIVRLTMSEAIDAAYPCAASAFTIGGHTGSGNVAISGIYVDVTVTAPFIYGEAARTVSYTQPGTNNLRDVAGNLLGTSGAAVAITNNLAAPATKPATMAAPVATAGQLSASVAFVLPANGGSAITSVTITASTGQTASGLTSPISITMPAGTAATFTAKATNAIGTGDPSPASNSVTPSAAATVPAAPTIGTAVAGDGYVDVYYTANGDGGSAILDATATLSTGETATGATSPIRVTAANGTARTATVKTRNTVGLSAASAASNSVTPAAPAAVTARFINLTRVVETGPPYVYTGQGTTTFGQGNEGLGRANVMFQDGVDGSFAWRQTSTPSSALVEALLGISASSTASTYNTFPYALVHLDAKYTSFVNGSESAPEATVAAAANDWMRMRRVGSTLYAEVSKNGGSTYTVIKTWTGAPTGVLYAYLDMIGAAVVDSLTTVGMA